MTNRKPSLEQELQAVRNAQFWATINGDEALLRAMRLLDATICAEMTRSAS
jgi:hypothetical protein